MVLQHAEILGYQSCCVHQAHRRLCEALPAVMFLSHVLKPRQSQIRRRLVTLRDSTMDANMGINSHRGSDSATDCQMFDARLRPCGLLYICMLRVSLRIRHSPKVSMESSKTKETNIRNHRRTETESRTVKNTPPRGRDCPLHLVKEVRM